MATTLTGKESPAHLAVEQVLKLHELSLQGKGNSPEATAACDTMEATWHAMSRQEQERVGGLSEDLYTLQDGGAKQVEMTPAERQQWAEEAKVAFAAHASEDYDSTLAFLRRPAPEGLPRHIIPFLQGRCWEHLGEVQVALLFMREAERIDPSQAVSVFSLLQQVGPPEEVERYVVATPPFTETAETPAAASLPDTNKTNNPAAPARRSAATATRTRVEKGIKGVKGGTKG
jgi:hypothetical protein